MMSPFHPPKYSPSLNEVKGRAIKMLKKNIYTNHTYQSIEELKDTTRQYLNKYLDLTQIHF